VALTAPSASGTVGMHAEEKVDREASKCSGYAVEHVE
jgi:hypothetical protein